LAQREIVPELTYHYEHLGDITNIFAPPELEDIYADADEESPTFETEIKAETGTEKTHRYQKLGEPQGIVTAPVVSHILVNAGPGTGKTYTIIRRLEYLAKTQAVEDFHSILVLCYTNAAKNEIRKRLEAGIIAGELPPETKQFDIRTFDSLATAYLAEIEDETLATLDYNGRIARFNENFEEEMFSTFTYVIIDEMQDLVNERARMTLNVLSALTGGWLLCGDRCQAIYDYDCDGFDKISSVNFYEILEQTLPPDTMRYELIGNRRQNEELAKHTDNLREALLEFTPNEVNDFFLSEVSRYQPEKFSAKSFRNCDTTSSTAILCRSNGEAEWVSAKLHLAGVAHHHQRSVVQHISLKRWLADVFWDFREKLCGRKDFVSRYCARVCDDESQANTAFAALVGAVETMLEREVTDDFLDMANVKKALRVGAELDACLLNLPVSNLTVSTIHKAKGREFDKVYLLHDLRPKTNNTEESRIWYVGATRPRAEMLTLKPLKKHFSKRTQIGRCACTGISMGRFRGKTYSFCTHISVGFPEDNSETSFIDGNLQQALANQCYISENISINDKLELRLHNNLYEILHNGRCIGTLSSAATQDFWEAVRKTDNKVSIPPFLSEVFVTDIVTIRPNRFPAGVERMYKESGFWLGVELTGFAKANWHYEGGVQE
jgi:hypothetical protein